MVTFPMSDYSTLALDDERLHFSNRKLRRFILEYNIPVLQAGRDIRFDEVAFQGSRRDE